MGSTIQSFDQAWSVVTLYQILVGSASITMVMNVTWFVISWLLKHFVRIANRRISNHHFLLGEGITRAEYQKIAADIAGFYCLIVRHGTDEYISRMASDQERFEGRQQLKLRPILVRYGAATDERGDNSKRCLSALKQKNASDEKVIFQLKLPVHKRLGTQFKCFAVSKDINKIPAIISMLNTCEHVSDIKQSGSYHKNRVYFLLDQFFVIDTITPGIRNNFVFPE
jgi:hypothetical protein